LARAAITGFEAELRKIDERIAALKDQLRASAKQRDYWLHGSWEAPKRGPSLAGRKRIAAAQRLRWAKAKREANRTQAKRKKSRAA
jgi:hypothetical protein